MPDLTEARTALEAGEAARALEILEGLKEACVGTPKFHYFYGLAIGRTGDHAGGIEQLNRAISLGEPPFWVLHNRGVFEFRRNNHERAAADLFAASVLQPNIEEPRRFLLNQVLPNGPGLPSWLVSLLPAVMATVKTSFDRVNARLENMQQQVDQIRRDLLSSEDRDRDLLSILTGRLVLPASQATLETDYAIASGSADHRFPRGTGQDNTRHPRFVYVCERLFGRKIRHLDLGCAGGGLVWDFLLAGHDSYGIEGSDYSLLNRRAEWRTIDDRLYTGDITKPFRMRDLAGEDLKFDIVTAWEVLEHIPEGQLSGLIANIDRHLRPGGLFAASVAMFKDEDRKRGIEWHVTLRPEEWWHDVFRAGGFEIVDGLFETPDFPRGSGNPRAPDWSVSKNPALGFHLVCRKPEHSGPAQPEPGRLPERA